ncbi:MAG: sigma 54-interacting transcriptional regulator [Thermodesulfobacteriota bacterium]
MSPFLLPLFKEQEEPLLTLAAFFEGKFSIDWIQALTEAKATEILRFFDRYCRDGLLKRHDLGEFSFIDPKKRRQLRNSVPSDPATIVHQRIAETILKETTAGDSLLQASSQLLNIKNELEGCALLCQAGDLYRKSGRSAEALACYEKAIQDLKKLEGLEVDRLYIQVVIGYSKDHRAVDNLNQIVFYLQEALARAERWKNPAQQALVLMHLAFNIYLGQNAEAAQAYLDRGFELAKGLHDPNVERTLITGTIVSHFFSGRCKEAVKIFETSEPLFAKKYPSHKLSLRLGILMGLSYAYLGQITQGLGLLDGIRLHAMHIEDYDTAATAAVDMGLVLMLSHKYDEAISLISSTLVSKKGSEFAKYFGLYYLSFCYFRKGEMEKSSRYFSKAFNISNQYNYDQINLPHFIEVCLAIKRGEYPSIPNIHPKKEIQNALTSPNLVVKGAAYRYWVLLKGNQLSAEERLNHLKQSLVFLEESGQVIEIANTKLELGRHFLQTGEREKAKVLVAEAAKILYPIDRGLMPDDLEHLIQDFRVEDNLLSEILNLGQEIVGLRDTQEVVQHIFSTVNRITGAERGAIFLKNAPEDPQPIRLWAAKNLTANDLEGPEFSSSLVLISETARNGKIQIKSFPVGSKKSSETGNRFISCLCVPLSLRGKTIGVLYHDNRFFKNTFKDQNLEILSYFASLAAIALDNALAYEEISRLNQRLYEEKQYLEEQQMEGLHPDNFIAASPVMKKVLSMCRSVAKTESTVLILGETGVGKGMVARAIQQFSSRSERPFIRVHCSALPESLIPSELFGHERGAFTGAVERRIGRFELADGGTLFLDEIGDIPPDVQVRLLRVLQTGEFERVGGRETLRSDFRLLTATNRNLEEEVAAGRFRADLYYRLNVFPITVPPLRERREDISSMANYFLHLYSEKMGKAFKGIPEREMAKLLTYPWPGNVRELENVIERGVILTSGPLFRIPELSASGAHTPSGPLPTLKEMERRFIVEALNKTNWKISGAGGTAELLGINYNTLYSRMKKLGLRKKGSLPNTR